MQRVLASYWHIGFYAHPRLPELLIAGRERDYLAEFIRTYQQNREALDKEDLDEYAHHIASPGGLRGMPGVYRAIAAEAQDLIQLTHTMNERVSSSSIRASCPGPPGTCSRSSWPTSENVFSGVSISSRPSRNGPRSLAMLRQVAFGILEKTSNVPVKSIWSICGKISEPICGWAPGRF